MRRTSGEDLRVCAPVLASATPVAIDAGPDAVLLCHGFTGMPMTMRFWAEHLAGLGYTVRVPRLPGHGTRWQEMNRVRWQDWTATIRDAYRELAAEHERVAVCGLSMGGALALWLAEREPDLAGVVLVNPAVYSTDPTWRFLPAYARTAPARWSPGADVRRISFPGITADDLSYDWTPMPAAGQLWDLWRTVRAGLPRVRQPLLVFKSVTDHVVDDASLELIQAGVASADVTVELLTESFHVATVDVDAQLIFERSGAWLRDRFELRPVPTRRRP